MCVHYQSVVTYIQIRGGRKLINKQIKGGTGGGGGDIELIALTAAVSVDNLVREFLHNTLCLPRLWIKNLEYNTNNIIV